MKITDVVFTNHAIERMQERGISGDWAWQCVKQPDNTKAGKQKHTTEFEKKFGNQRVTCVGKKNEIGEWVVLSVWMDPPLTGTRDYNDREKYHRKLEKMDYLNKKMERASFWGKLWITFRKQLGW